MTEWSEKEKRSTRNTRINFTHARHIGQRPFYSAVLCMAWSRTREEIQEARVAKHAFEEFEVQFDVVPNDNRWQI